MATVAVVFLGSLSLPLHSLGCLEVIVRICFVIKRAQVNHNAPPMRTTDKTKDSQRRPGGKNQHDTCTEGQLPRLPSQESVTDADQEAEISTTYVSLWPRPPRRLEVTGKGGPRLWRSKPIANGCAGTRCRRPSFPFKCAWRTRAKSNEHWHVPDIAAAPFQLQKSRRMPPPSQ